MNRFSHTHTIEEVQCVGWEELGLSVVKLSIPCSFCVAVVSLIYQVIAHTHLNKYIIIKSPMFQCLPHHPQGDLLILAHSYLFIVLLLHVLQSIRYIIYKA